VASKLLIKVGLGSSAAVALLITSYILAYHSEVLGISPAWDVSSFQVWYQTGSIKVRMLLAD
jgi:phosphomevalonate kinase